MKILAFFFAALTFSNLTWATVEYGTLDVAGGNTSLVLNQGDVFQVTNFNGMYTASSYSNLNIFSFTAPDGTDRTLYYSMSNGRNIISENITIYGPTTITLSDVSWLMYKLTRAPNPQPATAATTEN
jgi:hypothetical protein